MNSACPQSKQTITFGNAKTDGWSKPVQPGKWRLVSASSNLKLADSHTLQFILRAPRLALHGHIEEMINQL